MKKIALLLSLVFFVCVYSQTKKLDTVNFEDLKFNNNYFITKFSNIKKYINPVNTKSHARLGKMVQYPFTSFKKNENVYYIYNQWVYYFISESNPKWVYIQNVSLNKKVSLTLKKLRLTKKLKVENLSKLYKNSYSEYKKNNETSLNEKFFKIVLKQKEKYGILEFCFINGKFSYLAIMK